METITIVLLNTEAGKVVRILVERADSIQEIAPRVVPIGTKYQASIPDIVGSECHLSLRFQQEEGQA
jgi:hypothetical protein